MGARVLKIPEDIVAALRIPPDDVENELNKELAVALYSRGMLPSGSITTRRGPAAPMCSQTEAEPGPPL